VQAETPASAPRSQPSTLPPIPDEAHRQAEEMRMLYLGFGFGIAIGFIFLIYIVLGAAHWL
jgi:hypothetical protein